ncbi:MAG: hypothetical protein IMZ53_11380 [Thermoplasmata archaeon]|nr:hypothetical protein [Thermoplasmata archaeon]
MKVRFVCNEDKGDNAVEFWTDCEGLLKKFEHYLLEDGKEYELPEYIIKEVDRVSKINKIHPLKDNSKDVRFELVPV